MIERKKIKPYIYRKELKKGISVPEELNFNGESVLVSRYFGMDFEKEHYIIDTTDSIEEILEDKIMIPSKLYKLEDYCKSNLTAITNEIIGEKELFYNFSKSMLNEKKNIDKKMEKFSEKLLKKVEDILTYFKKDGEINSQYPNYDLNEKDKWWRLN
jgi:hypothetical protein